MDWRDKVIGGGVGYALGGLPGAAIGVALAGGADDPGYDLSDVPFGIHVEVEHADDAAGRCWTLRFVSEVPPRSLAVLRLLDDAAVPIAGREPFVDEQGQFTACARIERRVASLRVPWTAMDYASSKHLSLEVTVWSEQGGRPAAAAKAIVDADLPDR